MKRIKWWLNETAARLDPVALAGLALCAGALAIELAVTAPLQADAAQGQREAAAVGKLAADTARRPGGDLPAGAGLDTFYPFFPSRQSAPDVIEKIHAAAASQGLELAQGDYRLGPEKNEKLVPYQIHLPVKGSYAQVRQFVLRVLDQVPAAALDELVLTRDAIGSGQVQAKIRLTLYLRTAP